jgi:hypothetical protein
MKKFALLLSMTGLNEYVYNSIKHFNKHSSSDITRGENPERTGEYYRDQNGCLRKTKKEEL